MVRTDGVLSDDDDEAENGEDTVEVEPPPHRDADVVSLDKFRK